MPSLLVREPGSRPVIASYLLLSNFISENVHQLECRSSKITRGESCGKLIGPVLSSPHPNMDVSIMTSAASRSSSKLLVFLACLMRVMFHQQVRGIRVHFVSSDEND